VTILIKKAFGKSRHSILLDFYLQATFLQNQRLDYYITPIKQKKSICLPKKLTE